MKSLMGFVCFVLVTQGIGGLLYELTDGRFHLWALTRKVGFLDGYQIYADIGLIALGIAVGTAVKSAERHDDSHDDFADG